METEADHNNQKYPAGRKQCARIMIFIPEISKQSSHLCSNSFKHSKLNNLKSYFTFLALLFFTSVYNKPGSTRGIIH